MDNLVHTPLVPFCVLRRGCKAGIMITASHNPKEDNGYKVYWGGTGAQIIPPHDSGIASCIEANLQPWASYGVASLEAMLKAEWAAPVGCYTEELSAAYYRGMAAQLCCHPVENAASTVKIVHTAMHGVGHQWTVRAFEAFGLPPPTPVEKQRDPDPTFPTVAFPNPEEVPNCRHDSHCHCCHRRRCRH